MTGNSVPSKVDLVLFSKQGRQIRASMPVADMPRLTGLLADASGTAELDLQFGLDSGRRAVVHGSIRATVMVTCQRCLEPMALALEPQINVAMVGREDEADSLPEELDPLLCPSGEVVVGEFVQDELILALPVIPRHENDVSCVPLTGDSPGGDGVAPEEVKDNPFAVLSTLRERGGDQGSNQES
ncbi:YceD family protein [Aquisalimonas sp.]|uniref:YceD family protein n=1 Tax=unclassified Aquisalimonas TaxID=2644645 RepID=UPI0025C57C3B|nr:YceD family protein [Aquisalimonas sp.]